VDRTPFPSSTISRRSPLSVAEGDIASSTVFAMTEGSCDGPETAERTEQATSHPSPPYRHPQYLAAHPAKAYRSPLTFVPFNANHTRPTPGNQVTIDKSQVSRILSNATAVDSLTSSATALIAEKPSFRCSPNEEEGLTDTRPFVSGSESDADQDFGAGYTGRSEVFSRKRNVDFMLNFELVLPRERRALKLR